MPSGTRWGDFADDSSTEGDEGVPTVDDVDRSGVGTTPSGQLVIPPTRTSRVNSKGIKIVTSYSANPTNPNQLLKTETKIRVTTTKIRENVAVEKRRQWKKFGQAALDEDQSNITIQSQDDIYIEDPHADTDLQDEDPAKALAGNLNEFWAKQQRRQLERKFDVDTDEARGAVTVAAAAAKQQAAAADAADGWRRVGGLKAAGGGLLGAGAAGGGLLGAGAAGAAAVGGAGRYVPPSARAAGVGGPSALGGSRSLSAMAERAPGDGSKFGADNRDQNTIRVTNISEDTTEADLQDLFQPFGRISRVYLAKDKETMVSRGFAFVSFVHREDAARAMEKLQGFGYDHLILKLEWARPSAPKDPATSGGEYRTGYGKALAQDTKEKVAYASNLTRGTR